jgi:phosphoribosylanthranilate isomerase
MSRVDIKICGLSTPEAIDAAVRGGASHIGFNFFPRSPRYVTPDQAEALARRVPPHVKSVGIFVDPDDAVIGAAAARAGLDAIQLHGKEAPERATQLKLRTGLDIWKAISVKTANDLATASAYADAADFLLYDAKTPDGAALPGGMGMRFDWTLLAGHRPVLPWGLSGGLDPDNVAEAIRLTKAPLVDVSSGVESAPGIKDVDKIAAFCKAVSQC